MVGPSHFDSVSLSDFKARVGWCLLDDTLREVIEPMAGDTPHSRLLKECGPGLHILGVKSHSRHDRSATHGPSEILP